MLPRRGCHKSRADAMTVGEVCLTEVFPARCLHDGAAPAGPPGRAGSGVQRDRRRRDAAALPDGAAGAGRQDAPRDRAAGVALARDGAAGAAPLRGGRPGGGGDRGGGEPGDGAAPPARGRLRVQAADLDAQAQGRGEGRVPGKRARVEALLAMASPEPPPCRDLLADLATLIDLPPDLPALLARLPGADLYLQDEIQCALHPTLTRVWCRRGRRGQRLVEAPGGNATVVGFGALDWRDGFFHGLTAPGRRAAPMAEQLTALADRSRARGRIAVVLLDNLGIHTAAGSRLVRQLLAERAGELVLVYTPAYDPDANRIEWLWRPTRRAVTHTHRRTRIADLDADLTAHFAALARDPTPSSATSAAPTPRPLS